jgi:hypothetical protein
VLRDAISSTIWVNISRPTFQLCCPHYQIFNMCFLKFPLKLNDTIIPEVDEHKHLGVCFQSNCSWHSHITHVCSKVGPLINCLRSFKYRLNRKSLELLYKAYILPIFDYCDHVWSNCTQEQERNLEKLHLDAIRTICGAVRGTSHEQLIKKRVCAHSLNVENNINSVFSIKWYTA